MARTRRAWHGLGSLLIFVLLLLPRSAAAQELTGTLYGKATAEDGALLPGVTVTITSPRLIRGAEVRVTDQTGGFRVPALPPGVYSVQAELQGFQTVTRQDVVLTAGAALALDFTLSVAAVQETVTVTGESPLVDVRSAQTTRTVDRALLENVPTGRNFADIIVTAPGVIDSEYGFAPSQTVHGSSVRDNVFNVDGAVANDSTVGYMSTQVPFDVIDEVQITSGGISAEFGQASGAVFNFITKSGGNSFSGGGNIFLRNENLEGDNVDADLLAQGLQKGTSITKDLEYGFNLGGPIKRNKVWVFGNLRWTDLEQQKPDFPAADPLIEERQSFLKVTSQLLSKTNLQGSWTQVNREDFPSNGSFQTNNSPETWSRGLRDQKIFYTNLTHVVTDATFLDVQFGYTLVDLDSEQALNAVGSQDLTTNTFFGGWTGTAGKTFERDKRTIKASMSHFRPNWLGGSHSFKAGFFNEFSPFARVRDIFGDTFQLFQNNVPYRVRLYNTPRTPRTNVTAYAVYVQDEWTIRDRVTLNLGVRVESTEGWQPEQESGGGRWFPVERFPEQRDQIKWLNAAPRVGIVWNVREDKRTSARFAYGRYYNTLLNQHVLAANRGQAGFFEYDWVDLSNDRIFQDGEQTILRRNLVASRDDFDPDLRQPYVDAIHVGFDQGLGTNFLLAIAGIYKRERDIMDTINVTLPFSAYRPINVVNKLNGQPLTIFALDPRFQGLQSVSRLTNPEDPLPLYRDYYGVEMVGRRRLVDRWQFQASLNLGRSRGTIGNSFGASSGLSSLYDNPNTLINAEGTLDLDAPVQVKLQGTYIAPYDILLSAFYSGISGFPLKPPEDFPTDKMGAYTIRYTRADSPDIVVESEILLAGEPRATHRFDFRNKMSLRVEKQFALGGTRKLGLIADVFNLFNINTVTAVQTLRVDLPNFLRPAIIETPRALRLGARFSF